MPTAGDEGYEVLVICPYDRSHEVRRGRMQFHLDKCRKNFPEKSKEMVQCPYNSIHLIPRFEEMFHTQEECSSRANFDRHTHKIGDVSCPVKDLVPVNGGTSSVDATENWDDFEAQGSVLNVIKETAKVKPILRMMQCESKAKRKKFRVEERKRYEELISKPKQPATEPTPPPLLEEAPLRRPTIVPSIPVKRQDPAVAAETLNSYFKSMDLNKNPSAGACSLSAQSQPKARSPTPTASSFSSRYDNEPSMSSYASMSSSRPTSALSSASAHNYGSEYPTSYASASSSRPSSSMSAFQSVQSSPTTGLSSNRYSSQSGGDGFCQIPLPGLGRGSRRKVQN